MNPRMAVWGFAGLIVILLVILLRRIESAPWQNLSDRVHPLSAQQHDQLFQNDFCSLVK